MSNIDKQALREEFRYMQDHYSDPADRERQEIYIAAEALLDENIQRQREKDAIEAVALAMRDDMRQAREQLEAAEKRNAEQQRSLDHRKFLLLSADEVQRDFAEALECAGDNESIMEAIDDLKQHIAELESKNGNLRTIAHDQNELAIKANLDSINDTVEMDSLHKRIAELEAKLSKPVLLSKTNGYWTEQEKAYEEAITFAKRQVRLAGFNVEEM